MSKSSINNKKIILLIKKKLIAYNPKTAHYSMKKRKTFKNKLTLSYFFLGLITTTARKLDRENQPEHILEVCIIILQL